MMQGLTVVTKQLPVTDNQDQAPILGTEDTFQFYAKNGPAISVHSQSVQLTVGPDTIQNHKGSSLDAILVQPQNFPLGWNDVLKILRMVRPPEHPTRNYLVLLYSLRPP